LTIEELNKLLRQGPVLKLMYLAYLRSKAADLLAKKNLLRK
jgi:hypothetical protein